MMGRSLLPTSIFIILMASLVQGSISPGAVSVVNGLIGDQCALIVSESQSKLERTPFTFPRIIFNTDAVDGKVLLKTLEVCHYTLVLVKKTGNIKRLMIQGNFNVNKRYIFLGDVDKTFFEDEAFSRYLWSIFITDHEDGTFQAWKHTKPLRYELSRTLTPEFQLYTHDFKGYRLIASAFTFAPYSNLDKKAKFKGFEYEIANAIASSLNLNMRVRPPLDGELWGHLFDRDTFNYTGLLGELGNNKADIGWANLFISEFRKNFMDFSKMYSTDQICFMVAKPDPYPKIMGLIFPFDFLTWTIGLLLVIFGGVLTLLLSCYFHAGYKYDGFSMQMLFPVAIVLEQSVGHIMIRDPRQTFRFFVCIFALGMFVVSSGYKGGLISFLTVDVQRKPIDTFDELLKATLSLQMQPTCCCPEWIAAMKTSLVPSHRELGERTYDFAGRMAISFKNVTTGNYATFYTKTGLAYGVRQHLLNENGETKAHISSECTLYVNTALGLQQNSPFKHSIDIKMTRLREAGLIEKWRKDGENSLGILREQGKKVARTKETLSLTDIGGVFLVLISCLIGTILVVCSEVWNVKKCQLTMPWK